MRTSCGGGVCLALLYLVYFFFSLDRQRGPSLIVVLDSVHFCSIRGGNVGGIERILAGISVNCGLLLRVEP